MSDVLGCFAARKCDATCVIVSLLLETILLSHMTYLSHVRASGVICEKVATYLKDAWGCCGYLGEGRYLLLPSWVYCYHCEGVVTPCE